MTTAEKAQKIQSINPQYENGEQWEQPEPLSITKLLPLPENIFPAPFGDYIISASKLLQIPPDMCAMFALVAVGTAIQGKIRIKGRTTHKEPLAPYMLLVADPGSRKSDVVKIMTGHLNKYVVKKNEELKIKIQQQETELEILQDELARAKKASSKEKAIMRMQIKELESNMPTLIQLIADDITPEELATKMYCNNEKMSIISSEGSFFTMLAGQYQKLTNIGLVKQAWSNDFVQINRRNRDESMKKPHLTIGISLQPSALKSIFENPIFVGEGLVARFLYCNPMERISPQRYTFDEVEEIDDELKAEYEKALEILLSYEPPSEVEIDFGEDSADFLTLSAEAKPLLTLFKDELIPLEREELHYMKDFTSKFMGTTLRLIGLLHIMAHYNNFKDNLIVTKETVEKGIELAKYYLEHCKWAYGLAEANGTEGEAKYVLGKIKEHSITNGKGCDILRICRRYSKIEELTPILELLEQKGYCKAFEQEWSGQGRKPNDVYKFNPYIFESEGS